MRILTTILLLALLSCNVSKTLTKDFDHFYNKYGNDKDIIAFSVPIFLVKAFIDDNSKEDLRTIGKFKKVRLFVCDKKSNPYSKIIKDYLPNSIYSDLMVVSDNSEKLTFKIRNTNNEVVDEILMIISSPKNFVAAQIKGSFKIKDLRKAVKNSQMEDMLKNMNTVQ